jgi:peptidoglycan/xylan/chitin deacetylase (PgdA/CDA1 family)
MNLNIFKTRRAILNYHRICSDEDLKKQNDELSVSVSKFKEQLIFLKKNYNFVSLDDFLNLKKGEKSKITITFDDGYKDNLTHALPILNELNIPATIYIVTKFFENEFNVWWYELQEYIWKQSENIKFTFGEKNYNFKIKNNADRLKSFFQLKQIIKKLNKSDQSKFLSILTKTDLRKQYKDEILSKEDLKFLCSNNLITIGAHTHNHLCLKKLEKEECIEEIKISKEILENLTARKINHFSYPYGTKNDAGKREFKIVKDLGFKSGVTTCVGTLSKNKLFNLPRIHINQKANERILTIKLSFFYFLYKKAREIINI